MDGKKPREIIREELQKLSGLSWGERLGYIWDYYKPLMAAVLVFILLISTGITMYHNLQQERLIDAYFVNCNGVLADSEAMANDFAEYIGGLKEKQEIYIDTSLSIGDGLDQYSTASQTKITALASAKAMDVIVMDEETFNKYYAQGFFADLEELLSAEQLEQWADLLVYRDPVVELEETEESENETDQGTASSIDVPSQAAGQVAAAIDLTESPALEKYNIYTDKKVYGGVFVQAECRELFGEFFEFLLQ